MPSGNRLIKWAYSLKKPLLAQIQHNTFGHICTTDAVEGKDGVKSALYPALQISSQPSARPEQPCLDGDRVEFQVARDLLVCRKRFPDPLLLLLS